MPTLPALFRCVTIGLGLAVSGCTMPTIPQDQLHSYALLVPQDLYGNGAAITEIDRGPNRVALQMTLEGLNILPGVNTRPGVNVRPGRHSIEVRVCRTSSTESCRPETYIFEVQPGVAYILRGSGQTIVMLDRFNKSPLGELYPAAQHAFVSQQEWTTMRNTELTAAVDAGLRVSEQRQREQPMIRKVGAHVCQEAGSGILYSGYVEKLTDDKVQIRIVEAHFKGNPSLRPGGFVPSTIWASSMQWDLCN